MQHSIRLCSFCNFYHGNVSKLMHQQIRINVTSTNLKGCSLIKKRTKKKISCSEVFEEALEKSNITKTSIQRINTSNKTMLVDHGNIFKKSSKIENPALNKVLGVDISDNNSTPSNNEDNLSTEGNICTLFKATEHNKELYNNVNTSGKLNNTWFTNTNRKRSSLSGLNEKQSKNPNNIFESHKYITSLLAHMQVYLSCRMINRAIKTLKMYRKNMLNKSNHSKQCIELYNIVLEALAFRKDLAKVLQLYEMIKCDSVQPTAQTYVYIFDAIERSNTKLNQLGLLQDLISDMNSNKITINDIFEKVDFKHDQRGNVLKVIALCIPNFEPIHSKIDSKYMCKLLTEIPVKENYSSEAEGTLSTDELQNQVKEQLQYEEDINVSIESINLPQKDMKSISKYRNKIAALENVWTKLALEAFERNLKCLKEKERHASNMLVLHPFLEVLDKKYYVNAILLEAKKIANGSETFSMAVNILYTELAMTIYKQYEIQSKKRNGVLDKTIKIYQKYVEWYLHPKNVAKFTNMNNRQVWQYIENEEISTGTSLNAVCYNWPKNVIISVGKFLYSIILNDLILIPNFFKGHEIKNSIPAFYTLFRHRENYLIEQIKPHPVVSKLYKESESCTLTFNTMFVPSVSPPRPWTSVHTGGYLISSTDFIRFATGTDNSWQKLQKVPVQQLYPIFDSLNQLGSVPWTINSSILDIVIQIFQQGGSMELNVPQSVSMLTHPSGIKGNDTPQEKRKKAIELMKFNQKKNELYSLWCDTLYKLSLANHFRNKVFWLPHNLDFRGRVYPIPPHLNHLASDLSRSLLLFAKPKPLGPKGMDWLKLHVVNLTSKKKGSSLKERLQFANENIDNILDSATKPLTGKMWWTESEEPWQTLAGCMEIANAMKHGNVEKYPTRFPVHQDGSCNGLQHYAALGRDQIGAESVNLYPFDTPKDVYTSVAEMIEKNRKIEAKNQIIIAQLLEGFVKRKVIKQTVMTTVYGVTKYGAKLQITKQLEGKFPEEHIRLAGTYLTEQTFLTLRKMFESARQIQDWFTSCAQIISSVCGKEVEWITPLGLPVVQPYIKQLKKFEKPDNVKQKNAFAPNFIHSLDSTHMMLTSIHCEKAGITFVSVHDCFWTHASTVDIMNKICRQQFVALHSEPILEELSKFFVNHYQQKHAQLPNNDKTYKDLHATFLRVPSKGTFNINNVLSSTYFFS